MDKSLQNVFIHEVVLNLTHWLWTEILNLTCKIILGWLIFTVLFLNEALSLLIIARHDKISLLSCEGVSGPVPHRGRDLPDVSPERTSKASGEPQTVKDPVVLFLHTRRSLLLSVYTEWH